MLIRRIFIGAPLVLGALLLIGWSGCGRNTAPTPSPSPDPIGMATGVKTPASDSGSGPRFVEVAQQAGIGYKWQIEGKRPLNILQTIGNGCAFLDYDNDGNLDILLVGPKLALYKGDGKGHFTDVTHETGLDKLSGHFLGCAVGDYDNDGFDDLYISAYRGGVLLHNVGVESRESRVESAAGADNPKSKIENRKFVDVTQAAGIRPVPWGTSCSFVDIDGDGKLDLYIGNYVQFGPNTEPQLCAYSGHMSACGPRFYQPERGLLYHNEGGGHFRDVTKQWEALGISGKALGVACADFDGSGRQSVAIANDEMAGDLLHNLGRKLKNIGPTSGTAYDNEGNVHGGMGIDWGDFDNDGKLDLAVATFQREPKCLYHNDGKQLFSDQSAALGIADRTTSNVAFGVKLLDFDNDGWLDIAFANGHVQDNIHDIDKSAAYKQTTQLFHNKEGKGFDDVSAQSGPAFQIPIVGRGLAIGDFDNDGRVDLLIVDSEGAPLLLHNETPNAGHWLLCKLEGTKSNRDGIGAIVMVEADGMKLVRRCATDGSYLSASDRRVHIGLGKATTADIIVRWPSGGTTTYKAVPADRVVTLREGDSTVR